MAIIFKHDISARIVNTGNGYETRQKSKEQARIPRFMLEGLPARGCETVVSLREKKIHMQCLNRLSGKNFMLAHI